ncbi:MAG: response regulator transcription factor [Chloroflexi bacterium]|nr:response regulator transcription factor [Chloroflexota bacterium]
MPPIRVLLADDHELVRAGIRALVEQIENVEVVAEANDGNEAVELGIKYKPDIVLMDVTMPKLGGIPATAQLVKAVPQIRVIILSMHSDKEYVMQALNANAKGYLLKGARLPELELAISSVARGETYLSPAAAQHVVGEAQKPEGFKKLTPRQIQVLQLIAQGENRKKIAAKLKVSPKTVDAFRAQLMQQLNLHDTASLVRYAIKMGLVREE